MDKNQLVEKSVLVVGSGVAGMQTALGVANSGYYVSLLSSDASPGINRFSAGRPYSVNHYPGWSLGLVADDQEIYKCSSDYAWFRQRQSEICGHPRIKIYWEAGLEDVEGNPGYFMCSVRQREELKEVNVASIILTADYEMYNAKINSEYGYGSYKNVVTSLEFKHMLARSATDKVNLTRPSDGGEVHRIAFIQCVGPRSAQSGSKYCSRICCLDSTLKALAVKTLNSEVQVTVFYLDLRSSGKNFDRYVAQAKSHGIRYIPSLVSSVKEDPHTNNLVIEYVNKDSVVSQEFDLVVLAVGLRPTQEARLLAEKLGLDLDNNGFMQKSGINANSTSRPGIFIAGGLAGPMSFAELIIHSNSAVGETVNFLANLSTDRVPRGEVSTATLSGAKGIITLQQEIQEQKALVIGGGIAGMTAVLELTRLGYSSYLVERKAHLGGHLRQLSDTLDGQDPRKVLSQLIQNVEENPLIEVMLNANVISTTGNQGGFKSQVAITDCRNSDVKEFKDIEHSVIIIATGGQEHVPQEYLLGEDPRVMTLTQLEKQVFSGQVDWTEVRDLAVIHCVGSRQGDKGYCRGTCCIQSLKNAIRIKEEHPQTEVCILYRDLRSYGLYEQYFQRARELKVRFIRFTGDSPPVVRKRGVGLLEIQVKDASSGLNLTLWPDRLALATGVEPAKGIQQLANTLKISVDSDGFLEGRHPQWEPLVTSIPGIFICGAAHAPASLVEAVIQAQGAVGSALSVMGHHKTV